jgi:transcriptional regulator
MYVRASHQPRSSADVIEVIRGNMFATLVTHARGEMIASHLPFMIDDAGTTLFAHMAKANPQSAALTADEDALVMFQGPHAYISPSWYVARATAPTWDYVAVHCYGRPRIHDESEARQNIERLVALMETQSAAPWSIAELSEESVHALLQNVVSFEIPIARMEGKFKLNQGDKPERIRTAIAQLDASGEAELAEWMRRYNDV